MAKVLSQYGYVEYNQNKLLDKIEKSLAGTKQYSVEVNFDLINPPYEPVNWRQLSIGKYGMMAKDGIHPDIAADQLGFSSGDEMVRKLLSAEKKRDRIERLTDERMLQKYGDLNSPEALQRATDEALHNQAHTKFLHTELQNLAKRTGARNVLAKAAKNFAEQAISRKKVRDIKAAQYSAAEARAAKNAEKSLAKGDRDSAADHKRAQLLNNYFFKAADKAQIDIDKSLRYLNKFTKESIRKSIDIDYLDQIDGLLEQYDLKKSTTLKEIERRKSLNEWIAKQEELGFEPVIDDKLINNAKKKSYKEMTYEEFKGLTDAIKNIDHIGRFKNKLLKAKQYREIQEAADVAKETIEKYSRGKKKVRREQNTWIAQVVKNKNDFFALHRKIASYFREMDGFQDGGVMWELFARPMNEAGDFETEQRDIADQKLDDLTAALYKEGRLNQKLYIPEIQDSLSKEARISIGLNWGNEINQKRVMDGEGWDRSQVQAILNTLSKTDWDFIQNIWDYLDTFRPLIAEKERRITGIEPEWVTPAPIDTKYGQYRGGYYPIKYDPLRSTRAEEDTVAEVAKQMNRGAYTRATTKRGFTKARTDTVMNRPIRYDFGVMRQHISEVIHDLAWHEWLLDTNRLLKTNQIDSAIRDYYGPEVLHAIKSAVTDIATGDLPAQNVFEKGMNYLRKGVTVSGLGLNLWTAALQPLGLTQSMVRIGPKWVAQGVAEWMKGAVHMEHTVANIYEKSSFMKLRGKTLQREINEIRNNIRKGGKLSAIESTFFYFITKAQVVADVPTWLGEYNKSVAAGNDEARSIALANQAVLDAQGGGQIKDLAGIQRGSPLLKLWTNFYSFFNTTYNLTTESIKKTRSPEQIGRLIVDISLLYFVPATIAALMREVFKNDCHGDIDCINKKVIQENVSYMAGSMVGVREISGSLSGNYGYQGPAGVRFLAEFSRLQQQIGQGEADEQLFKELNQVGGILFHYPAGQVDKTFRGMMAVQEGQVEGARAAAAVVFGPPKK